MPKDVEVKPKLSTEHYLQLGNATIAVSWIRCVQVLNAMQSCPPTLCGHSGVLITLQDGNKFTEPTPTLEEAYRLRQKIDFALGFVGAAMLKTKESSVDPPEPFSEGEIR